MGQRNVCTRSKKGDIYSFHYASFAEGSTRKAYMGTAIAGPNKGSKGVVKRYKKHLENKRLDNYQNEQLIWQQAVVYARLFNVAVKKLYASISYDTSSAAHTTTNSSNISCDAAPQQIEEMKALASNCSATLDEIALKEFLETHMRTIVVPQPQIITIDKKCVLACVLGKHYRPGELISIEEYLEGTYVKFNSNTGWQDQAYPFMQAFSHFTFYNSGGQELLCDLQGVDYVESKTVKITDPAIISAKSRFGDSDMGRQRMYQWIQGHKCNSLCHALKLNEFKGD